MPGSWRASRRSRVEGSSEPSSTRMISKSWKLCRARLSSARLKYLPWLKQGMTTLSRGFCGSHGVACPETCRSAEAEPISRTRWTRSLPFSPSHERKQAVGKIADVAENGPTSRPSPGHRFGFHGDLLLRPHAPRQVAGYLPGRIPECGPAMTSRQQLAGAFHPSRRLHGIAQRTPDCPCELAGIGVSADQIARFGIQELSDTPDVGGDYGQPCGSGFEQDVRQAVIARGIQQHRISPLPSQGLEGVVTPMKPDIRQASQLPLGFSLQAGSTSPWTSNRYSGSARAIS